MPNCRTRPKCTIPGCDRPHVARGWCKRHYDRWRAQGDPLLLCSDPTRALEWLKEQIATRDRSECWPWPFYQNDSGYGRIDFKGISRAHALALILDGKPKLPEKPFALHSCDNPPCCNPDHCRWGTKADNSADMFERGRALTGERSPRAKLTNDDVRRIRSDSRLQRDVAAQYGVGRSTICRIQRGTRWTHFQ